MITIDLSNEGIVNVDVKDIECISWDEEDRFFLRTRSGGVFELAGRGVYDHLIFTVQEYSKENALLH